METNNRKKKTLTTALAVAVAALLLIGGGTFAYLQSQTDDTINVFNTNQVTVDLVESTGSEYDIIPGTSQDKDPTVTVDNTVDAYVFVEVTDTTQDLVKYDIAGGWIPFDGHEGIYYREVGAADETKEFSVLAGDKVYYDAGLKNSDMMDESSKLKDGIELTFKAYAIQKDGFENVNAAYLGIPVTVSTANEFKDALGSVEEGQTIKLEKDILVRHTGTHPDGTCDTYLTKPNCTIDLNGRIVTVWHNGYVLSLAADGINIKNGTIKLLSPSTTAYPLYVTSGAQNVVVEDVTINGGIQVIGGSSATLRNVNITATKYYDVYLEYKSTVTIESGTFTKKAGMPHIYTDQSTDKVIVKGGIFDGSTIPEYGGNGTVSLEIE